MSDNDWVMVPRVPTPEMKNAAIGDGCVDSLDAAGWCYLAMLAAAPQPKEAEAARGTDADPFRDMIAPICNPDVWPPTYAHTRLTTRMTAVNNAISPTIRMTIGPTPATRPSPEGVTDEQRISGDRMAVNALRSLLRHVERCREAGLLVCDDIGPEELARHALEQDSREGVLQQIASEMRTRYSPPTAHGASADVIAGAAVDVAHMLIRWADRIEATLTAPQGDK